MQRLRDPESGCSWDTCQNFHSILPSTLEECYEPAQAIDSEDYEHIAEEPDDVLFTCVNLARHLELNAEASLRHATSKFERRFRVLEAAVEEGEGSLSALSEEQLDHLWREAKESLGDNNRGL